MLNYNDIARAATVGINFFRGGTGEFDCESTEGGTRIIDGIEFHEPKKKFKVRGFVRSPKVREVDGEMIIATDKLGVFDNSVNIENGYMITIDDQKYVVVEARPIRQTNITVAYRPILRRVAIHG